MDVYFGNQHGIFSLDLFSDCFYSLGLFILAHKFNFGPCLLKRAHKTIVSQVARGQWDSAAKERVCLCLAVPCTLCCYPVLSEVFSSPFYEISDSVLTC